jgi:hypothetical protein
MAMKYFDYCSHGVSCPNAIIDKITGKPKAGGKFKARSHRHFCVKCPGQFDCARCHTDHDCILVTRSRRDEPDFVAMCGSEVLRCVLNLQHGNQWCERHGMPELIRRELSFTVIRLPALLACVSSLDLEVSVRSNVIVCIASPDGSLDRVVFVHFNKIFSSEEMLSYAQKYRTLWYEGGSVARNDNLTTEDTVSNGYRLQIGGRGMYDMYSMHNRFDASKVPADIHHLELPHARDALFRITVDVVQSQFELVEKYCGVLFKESQRDLDYCMGMSSRLGRSAYCSMHTTRDFVSTPHMDGTDMGLSLLTHGVLSNDLANGVLINVAEGECV